MARANVARRGGDDFQARIFWLSAALLLDSEKSVAKVAYECGPRAFDDIRVEYDSPGAPCDHEGLPIRVEHIQCKWHTHAGTFGYQDLINPSFINATRYSLLQKLHKALTSCGTAKGGLRFVFKTNWRISSEDPLLKLIHKNSGSIDLNQLYTGSSDRSCFGRVRKLWREHLNIDDDMLRSTIRSLAIEETTESLMALRQRLDERFAAVGLKRIPDSCSAYLYDDLIAKLLGQGRVCFDRDSFREMARQEGILDKPANKNHAFVIGVRSFMHPIDRLEKRSDQMLDLVSYFDGRHIRNNDDWEKQIFPKLKAFIQRTATSKLRLRLALDSHISLAYAIGTLLNVKSGRKIEIEQRTGGYQIWSMDDKAPDQDWPNPIFEDEIISEDQDEIAVAIGLTHDVSIEVQKFVLTNLQKVGRILHCRPECGASQHSVHCGCHAWQLVESLVRHLLDVRSQGHHAPPVHVFLAGPNAFAFFLGQQTVIGSARIYEWDLEGRRGGGYCLGLTVAG